MDVYFDRNFWYKADENRDEEPGTCVKTDASFGYGGFLWHVPAVYVCREGIVLDICRQVPAEAVEEFFRTWGMWEGREEEMICAGRMEADAANPMSFEADFRLEAEGWTFKKKTGSCICILPQKPRAEMPKKSQRLRRTPEEEIAAAYGLDKEQGWQVFRQSFRTEGNAEKSGGRPGISPAGTAGAALRLTVSAGELSVPLGTPFNAEEGCGRRKLVFGHPVTGEPVEMEILGCSGFTADFSALAFEKPRERFSLPSHALLLKYAPVAGLRPGEKLAVKDCGKGDAPVFTGPKESGKAAAAVAVVIGGSRGPISVFAAGKVEGEEADDGGEQACSAMYFERKTRVKWQAWIERVPFEPEIFSLGVCLGEMIQEERKRGEERQD